MNADAAKALTTERDQAAEFALDAIRALRRQLDRAEATIADALDGKPIVRGELVPDAQRVVEAVTETTKFATLWEAAGLAERVQGLQSPIR